ncbi:unnamed protein product [Acanthoscelides obtectus]|uniref:Large ribosomal subunit protein P2 n=1 Tax=Acanthoscelides obtectus TaxID=200917 RepID=A0A9P0P5M1_ACAOB|nr:unnamed protein product [Acanthoscelides obtectus]CAK1651775.1 60S acidic ribosomal protein P2 [Acanthoscelides obtectus]
MVRFVFSFHALYLSLKDVFRVSFAFRVKRLKKMRYVAAYLLAVLGGKASPSSADIEKILGSVGVEADGERLKKVISELNGKSIDDLIAQGREKLCSMPVGGAAPAAAVGAAAAAAPAAAEEKKEAKKEEKKEDSESDDDMGFGLFD